MKKRILITISIVIAIVVIAIFLAGIYFANIVNLRPKDANATQPLLSKKSKLYEYDQKFIHRKKDIWEIKSDDDLKLKAWYLPAEKATNKTTILAHGWHDNKTRMRQYGELFHELGYNVLIPDNRASGESEGNRIGYGYLDRRDYINWIKKDLKENGNNQEIVLFGISMGAATVLSTAGEPDLPKQVKAVIADSAFTSVWDETVYQAKQQYGLSKFPMVYVSSFWSKILAGYSFKEANVVKQVAQSKVPIFFIHGGADDFVPTKMVYTLYDAKKYGNKEIWIAKGSKHVAAFDDHPNEFREKVMNFLDKNVKN